MKTRTQFVTTTKIKTSTLVGVGVIASLAFMAAVVGTSVGSKSIKVLTPNGSEQFIRGGSINVTWTNNTGNNVVIELLKSSSVITSWGPVLANVSTYNAILPSTLMEGSDYKIRISSVNNKGIADYKYNDSSDNNFTVLQEKVDIIAPNGGEKYYTYENIPFSIRIVSNKMGSLKIWINEEVLKHYYPIETVPATVNPKAINYVYKTTYNATRVAPDAGNNYIAYVQWISNDGTERLSDQSDNFFSIIKAPISIVSPNGGENLNLGRNIGIQWQTSPLDIPKVNVGYKIANTDNIVWFDKDVSNIGIYYWYVDFGSNDNQYAMMCVGGLSAIANNKFVQDCSDQFVNFNKQDQYIKLITPNGGEVLSLGTTYRIKWNYVNTDKLYLRLVSRTGGFGYITDMPIPNTGFYDWTVRTNYSNNLSPGPYKIQIDGLYNNVGNFTDISDNWFTIQ